MYNMYFVRVISCCNYSPLSERLEKSSQTLGGPCRVEMLCVLLNVLSLLTNLGLLPSIYIAGNCPEASRHLRRPSETAKTQPQPSSANRVRPALFFAAQ